MNLVKLYTFHGPMHIDSAQIAQGRTILTIYTPRGNRLADTARSQHDKEKARNGVHVDNLFASLELAEANYQRIIRDMQQRGEQVAA